MAHRLDQPVPYCQHAVRFQGTRASVKSFKTARKGKPLPEGIFIKLVHTQQNFVQFSYRIAAKLDNKRPLKTLCILGIPVCYTMTHLTEVTVCYVHSVFTALYCYNDT